MKPIIILSALISCFFLSCRKDELIIFEEPEIITPFTVKHLEGDYFGVEILHYEKWHYSGPITGGDWTGWPYTESEITRPAWATIENAEGNELNIHAEDVDFYYPNFDKEFVLDSTLSYEESDFSLSFTGADTDSLIIDLTVVQFDRNVDMISDTETSTYNLFTLKYMLIRD